MYFAIRRSEDGQYWWRAVGGNNEIMAASELMTTKQSCQHAIDVIRRQAAVAPVYDQSGDQTAPRHDRRAA